MQEKENKWLSIAKKAAVKAGEEILNIYQKDFKVNYKKDNSPLTIADQRANDVIEKILSETSIPILSEEGKQIDFEERKNWNLLWIVGTEANETLLLIASVRAITPVGREPFGGCVC